MYLMLNHMSPEAISVGSKVQVQVSTEQPLPHNSPGTKSASLLVVVGELEVKDARAYEELVRLLSMLENTHRTQQQTQIKEQMGLPRALQDPKSIDPEFHFYWG